MIRDVLGHSEMFVQWNQEEYMGRGWLDLDALVRNIAVSVRDERRTFDEFSKQFDEGWKKDHPDEKN
jgi:hypothetical protein